MSVFKIKEIWRKDESNQVLTYFDCHLKEYIMKKLGRGGQALIADILGVHNSTVSAWVNFASMPPSDKQCMIAKIVGVPRDKIWVFKDSIYPEHLEIVKLERRLARLKALYKDKKEQRMEKICRVTP